MKGNSIQTSITHFMKQKQVPKTKSESKNINKNKDKDSNLSIQDSQNSDKTQPILYNVQFYRNQRESAPSGDLISVIHKKWWGDYKLLQRHHGYIQWLFPNSFTSRFNSQSHALTKEQQKLFRTDLQIAKRYVLSYEMILEFFGMKLKSKVTGQITQQRRVNFKERYYHTLLTSFHNHMRITRILCSLTMIGLGRYAKKLSQFLNQELHSEKGHLKALAKYNVDKDWKIYSNYVETKEDLNVYLIEADHKSHLKRSYSGQMKEKFGNDVETQQKKQEKQKKQIQSKEKPLKKQK